MTMSDWSNVTRPIPVPNEWTQPFWDAAKQGVLAAGASFLEKPFNPDVLALKVREVLDRVD